MKKIGLFYGTETTKTRQVAEKIRDCFPVNAIEVVAVEQAKQEDFIKYTHLIVGTSTWFDGELPNYWDELLPDIESANLKGKKVALFGLGDQVGYPENFLDGVGILAETFESAGATIIGFTSADELHFERSRALKDGKLYGLAIDLENLPEKTDELIQNWTDQLKKEFAN